MCCSWGRQASNLRQCFRRTFSDRLEPVKLTRLTFAELLLELLSDVMAVVGPNVTVFWEPSNLK